MQALLLAAGMGRRLKEYTKNQTKCMLSVGGKTLLEHMAQALSNAGISKLIIVDGYEAEGLEKAVREKLSGFETVFVNNADYAKTNNIYSLWLAREYLAQDDTLLLESDLIYDDNLLKDIVDYPYNDVVAVAKYEHWMDGTVTFLTEDGYIKKFIEKKDFNFDAVESYYKTVNIYKFSKDFSKNQYIPFLNAYIEAYGKNQYYELVLKTLSYISKSGMKAYMLENRKWYEIDSAQDLMIARTLFAEHENKLSAYERHYGGYWRFDGLKDFCYLVNPYFPPEKMMQQLKLSFDALLRDYPSGMEVQKLIAREMFDLNQKYLLVGNGAAELINVLGEAVSGSAALSIPSFNEYERCFKNCDVVQMQSVGNDFAPDIDALMRASCECDALFIINPDNPSGGFIDEGNMMAVLDSCKEHNTFCVVDESFADFAEERLRYSLLKEDILEKYHNLAVIKSISKSYGVPGIRLGVLATADTELHDRLQALLPIWNINSIAEYFLQIYSLYESKYNEACNMIAHQREILSNNLKTISKLKVYKSQANYIMCELLGGISSKKLATNMLEQSNILIKNLSDKKGFDGRSFIRIAVKNQEENEFLFESLKQFLQ
ncbi:MAG: aminotransferase class I/II-fold pyridoxal phosphate-dependent enzyme [Christensenella sp.]